MKFSEICLDDRIKEGISAIGFEETTIVQELVIPEVINGHDVIVSAQTGTGKTAAFLLPLLHKIINDKNKSDGVQALIIVPTRELAVQIDQQIDALSYFLPVSSATVFGGGIGELFSREQQALQSGVDIVVCTTGRMLSHLAMKNADFSKLKYLVLDEADRMLDMGFYDDIMKIISHTPASRQNLLFSATMPAKIKELAMKILKQPKEIIISNSRPPEKIKQEAYIVYENQKLPVLKSILKSKNLRSIIIFCSTKEHVKLLSRELKRARFNIEEMHSDLEQQTRNEVMARFKNRSLNILVATDIVSRGIDIEDIDLVVNFDVPHDGEDYVHRIGRTARAASDGEAITFVGEKEQRKFSRIEQLIDLVIPKGIVPEEFGPVPEYNKTQSSSGFKRKKKNYSSNFKRNKPDFKKSA